MPKRTWQPSRIHRARVHGFRKRSSAQSGRKILKNRRRQGRKRIVVSVRKKHS